MTEARVERIEPDVWAARAFLQQARALLTDGSGEHNSSPGRQLLLHAAAIAACDAILAVDGRQVIGVEGGHRLRLTTAESLLAEDVDELFLTLDDARMDRNAASYRAESLPAPAVDNTLAAVTELVGLAEAHVAPHLPPSLS